MKTDRIVYVFLGGISILMSIGRAAAQEIIVPEGYELADSVVYRPASALDSLLVGKDVFQVLPSRSNGDAADVNVHQTPVMEESMRTHIASNKERTILGYRVRIFFDNRQTARVDSEQTLKDFNTLYPEVPAYRTYANPYFKVTVGDFRTKSEAMALLTRIRRSFPSAFVIKENINFPVLDKDNTIVADTVKVLRPKRTR